jgi:hypothetical protein
MHRWVVFHHAFVSHLLPYMGSIIRRVKPVSHENINTGLGVYTLLSYFPFNRFLTASDLLA